MSVEFSRVESTIDNLCEGFLNNSDMTKIMQKYSRKHLEEVLDYLSDEYYNTSSQTFSDDQYDIIKEYVLSQRPYQKIGAPVRTFEESGKNCNRTVELPLWLGSLDKLKPCDEKPLERWVNKFEVEDFVITPKIDGLSCLLEYTGKSANLKMYTRGDGKIGKDITVFSYLMPKIPAKIFEQIGKTFYIRGELIMKKKTFEKYQNKFTNARAMLVGVINSLTTDVDIDFVAYELLVPDKRNVLRPQLDQLKLLNEMGFLTPVYELIKKRYIDAETLTDTLLQWKVIYPYQMDGIVLTNNANHERNAGDNPKYQIAYKILCEEDVVEAVVEKVIWKVSKRGLLKPRVKIFPVEVGGITINYSSGFNGKYIYDNKIGPKTRIRITRSGDVIPYILEVLEGSQTPDMPPEGSYRWADGQNPIEIMTTEENSPDRQQALILNFFKTLKTKNISDKTVEKLYYSGYTTIVSILEMNSSDFKKIEGFATISANKIYENIKTSLTEVPLSLLLDAGNVFSHGIGTRKLEEVFLEYPTIMQEKDLKEVHRKILTVKGFSTISADAFVKGFTNAVEFLDTMKKYVKINEKCEQLDKNYETFLTDKIVVFSGFRDNELELKVKEMGGNVSSSVSKKTFMVIAKDIGKISGKLEDAKKLGVTIEQLDNFKRKIF